MKKINLLIFVTMMLLSVSAVSSQNFGQPLTTYADQYYSVIFDGEGEAIVNIKLIVMNKENTPLNKIDVELTGTGIRLMGVAEQGQVSQQGSCIRYEDRCIRYGTGSTCVQYDYQGNCVKQETPCLEYGSACAQYSGASYSYGYNKVNVEPQVLSKSTLIPIIFSTPLAPGSQKEILIMYKTDTYTKESTGVFKFDFETAKLAVMSNTVRVAINVQNDLILKGVTSNINYQPNIGFSKAMAGDVMSQEMVADVQNYGRSIQNQGGLVKTTNYLDPYESYTVEGKYAKSWFALNWGSLIIWIIVVIIVVTLIIWGARRLLIFSKESLPETQQKKHQENKHTFIIPFMTGFLTAIALTAFWVAIIFLAKFFDSVRGSTGDIIGLLLILFAVMMSLAALIGVPIYTGSRHGATTGAFTAISLIGWCFVLAIIVVLVTSIIF